MGEERADRRIAAVAIRVIEALTNEDEVYLRQLADRMRRYLPIQQVEDELLSPEQMEAYKAEVAAQMSTY